jgi:putative phosphoribosyl transferase
MSHSVISHVFTVFRDRIDAGQRLAEKLLREGISVENLKILGIPRGGVITAKAVSLRLGAPLDVVVSRKLRAPWNPELGIGAIAELEAVYINEDLVAQLGIGRDYIEREIEHQKRVIDDYVKKFRGGPLDLRGQVAAIVDDGVATGATVVAACISARKAGAERVIVAVPVISADVLPLVSRHADKVVAVHVPSILFAVGEFYRDFSEVTDRDVLLALGKTS